MAKTITSANAQLSITVAGIFPSAQQLSGFAVDDVFDTDQLTPVEVLMGVDGVLSAGFIFVPLKMNIALQADSPSIPIFDTWFMQQQTQKDVFKANGVFALPGVSKHYTMSNGVLTGYKPIPDAKKVLQPQKFAITWGTIIPSAV
jgi:hypothetical protein